LKEERNERRAKQGKTTGKEEGERGKTNAKRKDQRRKKKRGTEKVRARESGNGIIAIGITRIS